MLLTDIPGARAGREGRGGSRCPAEQNLSASEVFGVHWLCQESCRWQTPLSARVTVTTVCPSVRSQPTHAGIAYGTLPHRIDNTLLRFLPRRELGWSGSTRCAGGLAQALHVPTCHLARHLVATLTPFHALRRQPAPLAIPTPLAGMKAWIVGAASQGVRSAGSTLKLGAGWVAETAGKVTAAGGKGGAGGTSASAFAGDTAAPGDFSIAAGKQQGGGAQLGAPHITESAWEQVGGRGLG